MENTTTGLLLASCLLAAGVLARRRRIAQLVQTPAVDPLTELRQELEELRRQEDPLAVFSGLSFGLRRYLGKSFGFPALESTTTEIRRRLADLEAPRQLVARVERLLRHFDLVRFARNRGPITQDPGARIDEALEIAQEVEAHLAPPATLAESATEEQAA